MSKKDTNMDEKVILSPKRENFCQEFNIDGNATQAAIRAGYSEKSAESQASRLLTNAKITARVEQLRVEKVARQALGADDLINDLWKVARADIKDFTSFKTIEITDPSTQAKVKVIQIEVKDSDSVDGSMIQEISQNRDGSFKFKLKSSDNAQRLLKEIYFNSKHEEKQEDDIITFGGKSPEDYIDKVKKKGSD